jgi:hypothetical protein
MSAKDTAPARLRREAEELRETAIDMMEHACLLISKSLEIDRAAAKKDRAVSGEGNRP